ncbi:MAG: undecaprenyldiphospho-muramoylpentapeptide beta-N-acetylglucosaminyltransferase [Desulfovibrionaceae bacterium]|jgi:UDP-N-acetylglucosamine--N-acetylmuramyl-(pentapeptide) pyrophosphoryl-undecaprenol N-acetylglucosamine transferase|nr:undecaprenyldiphospho-muramoylpentapeptide beta-N-acetylglucosaminyltransferase [Desulfovibrionaceae bacterium]
MKRVLLTTGGTGGHVFPALAVADALRERFPGIEILFAGGDRGPERVWAADAGLRFAGLPARGVLGRGWRAAGAAWWLTRSVGAAVRLVREFRPEAVLGFGGYAGFSAVLAGWLLHVPTAIHEQNSVPGVANRVLGRLVRRVCISFPVDEGSFPAAKIVLTGNPVRAAIGSGAAERQEDGADRPLRILVLGGSQGARAVNDAVVAALPKLRELGAEVLHQAGRADAERTLAGYEAAGWDTVCVVPFIDDMAAAYAWADLAVCRAGATTVAELAVAGLPSVLIPFPHATHDHQTRNARYLESVGAAVLLAQVELDRTPLAGVVAHLAADAPRLAAMAGAARAAAKPDAALAVVEELEAIARA